MTRTEILFGKGTLTVEHDDDCDVLRPDHAKVLSDQAGAVAEALAKPIGSPPLARIAKAKVGGQVVIVISDITRPVPNAKILHPILDVLRAAGHKSEAITILIATGMHRPSTPEERVELVGSEIVGEYRIVDHRAEAQEKLVVLPEPTASGTTVWIDRLYAEADLKIVTGFIEPHFMAGFSGGRKAICPGLVNLETIQKFHSPDFLEHPKATFGVLEGNPCHVEAIEVARRVGIDFLVNVTVTTEQDITGVYAGDSDAAHQAGCAAVAEAMGIGVRRQYDTVVTCGGGYPLDTTFYQTVKGMCFAEPFVKQGGTMVIASGCAQGIGSDIYLDIMRRYAGGRWRQFIEDIKASDRVEKDQWEYEMQCRVLRKVGVEGLRFVTDGVDAATLSDCSVTPAPGCGESGRSAQETLNELLSSIRRDRPDASWAIIPSGPYILPRT
ncbi:MAG: nickel-dependent lactate racemase [Phycisphaerae bacterium]|nr:nickel-dependent lactate racemase [Phycisphaerae bacterium]